MIAFLVIHLFRHLTDSGKMGAWGMVACGVKLDRRRSLDWKGPCPDSVQEGYDDGNVDKRHCYEWLQSFCGMSFASLPADQRRFSTLDEVSRC